MTLPRTKLNLSSILATTFCVLSLLLDLACCGPPTPLHTQEFAAGANDLEGKQLYFLPTPGPAFYQRMVLDTDTLGNSPADDLIADVSNGVVMIDLGTHAINFYGIEYTTIFLGADGTIGMGEAGTNADLTAHFSRPQVSLLPVDPEGIDLGTISYDIVPGDSIAVTYADVLAGGEPATAQAEFFIRSASYGDIALTYQTIGENAAGVIGLSRSFDAETIEALLGTFGLQTPLTTETMTGTLPPENAESGSCFGA